MRSPSAHGSLWSSKHYDSSTQSRAHISNVPFSVTIGYFPYRSHLFADLRRASGYETWHDSKGYASFAVAVERCNACFALRHLFTALIACIWVLFVDAVLPCLGECTAGWLRHRTHASSAQCPLHSAPAMDKPQNRECGLTAIRGAMS